MRLLMRDLTQFSILAIGWIVLSVGMILGLQSCEKKVKAWIPQRINNAYFDAREIGDRPGTWLVVLQNVDGLEKAETVICEHKVCSIDPVAVFKIQILSKGENK